MVQLRIRQINKRTWLYQSALEATVTRCTPNSTRRRRPTTMCRSILMGARRIRTFPPRSRLFKFPDYHTGLRTSCHPVHRIQYRGSTLLFRELTTGDSNPSSRRTYTPAFTASSLTAGDNCLVRDLVVSRATIPLPLPLWTG